MRKSFALIVPVGVIIIWQIISIIGVLDVSIIPSPINVIFAFWEWFNSGELLLDLYTSMGRLIVGLIIGLFWGILFGLCSGRVKLIDVLFSPILNILRAFPQVAIIPLVIILFGIGDGAKIVSIAYATFFPVWLGAHEGAKRIPVEFLHSAKLLSVSKLERFTKVIVPASLPHIVSGARIGIALAFIMVFVSELSGASAGIGYRIYIAYSVYRLDLMIAALIFLGLLSAFADWLFVHIQQKFYWGDLHD